MKIIKIYLMMFVLLTSFAYSSTIEQECEFSDVTPYSYVDRFNRPDNDTLGSPEIPNNLTYVESSGDIDISENSLAVLAGSQVELSKLEHRVSDGFTYEFDFYATTIQQYQTMIYVVDSGNTAMLHGYMNNGGNFIVFDVTSQDDTKFDFSADTYYRIKIFGNLTTKIWNVSIADIDGVILYSNDSIDFESNSANNFGKLRYRTMDGGETIYINSSYIINGSVGCPLPVPPEPEVYNITIYNTNSEGVLLDSIAEDDEFKIGVNFTLNGDILNQSFCNITSTNLTKHFGLNIGNQTLADSGDGQTNELSILNTTLRFDTYKVQVCRLNIQTDLLLYVNGILDNTIDGSIIPLCDIGFHEEIKNTSEYNNVSDINFTAQCNGCDGLQRQLTLVSDDFNTILHYERTFDNHTEELTFNETLTIYRDDVYYSELIFSGDNVSQMTVSCNGTDPETFYIDIENVNLSVRIEEIDGVEFTSGMEIEQQNFTDILIDVFGDIITFLELNLSYDNGTVIQSTNSEFLSVNSTDITDEGILNITIYAEDDEGNPTRFTDWFILNDTTSPVISYVNPLSDNTTSSIVNQSFTSNVTISDINLFGYNYTLIDPNNNVLISDIVTATDETEINILKTFTPNITGIYTIKLEVSDDHTKKEWKPFYEINFDDVSNINMLLDLNNNIDMNITDINADNVNTAIREFKHTKLEDRIIFKLEFTDEVYSIDIKISADNIVYRQNSDYSAHLVINNKYWFDLEPYKDIEVLSHIDNMIEFRINNINADFIETHSIGGLNIINQDVSFGVVEEEVLTELIFNFDLTVQSNVILLFVLVFLYLGVMFIGFSFNNLGFTSLGFFIGIFLGILLWNLHYMLTFIFFFINIGIYYGIAKAKK